MVVVRDETVASPSAGLCRSAVSGVVTGGDRRGLTIVASTAGDPFLTEHSTCQVVPDLNRHGAGGRNLYLSFRPDGAA